jgi:hydrogenase-4 component B
MSANLVSMPPLIVLGSGLGAWALGSLTALFSGVKADHRFFSSVLLIGSALILGALLLIAGESISLTILSPIYFGLAPFAIRLDPLAGLFLTLLGVVVLAVAIYSPGYLIHFRERIHSGIYWSCMFVFLLSMAFVILSSNAICFFIFWEIMSLSSVALVASDHIRQRAQRAALIYLGACTVSGALLLGSFLCYHQLFNSWDFAAWHNDSSTLVPSVLLLLGIAVKAGLWPFHIWMPYAQSEAPTPVAAIMSGVMNKGAIYATIRLLLLNCEDGMVLGYLALFLGTISTVWGVLFALMERDLKRLLAYSTVENIGLIFIALALAFLTKHNGPPGLASLALAGALLTCINHSMFKTLLFLGAGSVDVAANTRDLSLLGGIGRRMPFAMVCFLIGSLSVCALPPLNGFANKWLVYQGLFNLSFQGAQVTDRAMALLIVGILSFVGALSLATYTKAVGICFLGKGRSDLAITAHETSQGMVAAQIFLAGACVVLGLIVPYVLRMLDPICADILTTSVIRVNGFFPINMGKLVLLAILLVVAVYTLLFNRKPGVSKFVTWDCGYGDLSARAEETGTSFSEPIARIFGPLLQFRITTEIKGKDRRHFPEIIRFETVTQPLLEDYVYGPVISAFQGISKALAKLQAGSIHLYLLYVFVTLLILIGIGIQL